MNAHENQAILIIDDSPDIHDLVEARLRPEDLRIFHAFSAEEGMQRARELRPDLILLDLDLGGISGLEVCRQMKTNADTAGLAIIFLTSTTDVATKVEAFEAGAVDYVTKPFDPIELRARARAALRTRRLQDLLATRAQLDGLTGLWNRAHLDERLAEESSAAERHNRELSVILLDIDHFKTINDRFGHPFGDMVLQRVAQALSKTVRASDTLCRYGGEEFAVILQETSGAQALLAAERMRAAIAALPLAQLQRPVRVTASFGVSWNEPLGKPRTSSPTALLAAADQALYDAKQAGRDRVHAAPG
jgi:two-component system cell cycle response regulator